MEREETLRILKALADRTRLRIVEFLLDGERCVCEIIPHAGRMQSNVSIQLGRLEGCGILESRKEGKKVFYRVKDRRVCDIFKALGYANGKMLKEPCCMQKEAQR